LHGPPHEQLSHSRDLVDGVMGLDASHQVPRTTAPSLHLPPTATVEDRVAASCTVVTEIVTPRGHFCSTPAPGSVVPRLGDRVVAFAQLPSRDALGEVLMVDLRSGLIVQRGDELLGPAILRSGRAADLGAVLEAVRTR
jgi:hypothetical protein